MPVTTRIRSHLLHILFIQLWGFSACTPAPTQPTASISTSTAGATEIAFTSTSAPPQPTTTFFAEKVNTRESGVALTSTAIFPTITPIRSGQRLWTVGAPLPTQRLELASAVLNGKIYVAGGSHVQRLTYARMEV